MELGSAEGLWWRRVTSRLPRLAHNSTVARGNASRAISTRLAASSSWRTKMPVTSRDERGSLHTPSPQGRNRWPATRSACLPQPKARHAAPARCRPPGIRQLYAPRARDMRACARHGVLVVERKFLPGSARRLGTVSAEPLSRAYWSQNSGRSAKRLACRARVLLATEVMPTAPSLERDSAAGRRTPGN